MYRGGIFDHVGGGFSRYSTDRLWLVPHFEKMLYDNALLTFVYAEAFQNTHRPLYAAVIRRTTEYVLRELQAPQGGFYCGQDADSDGAEGKYYVFTPAELRTALGAEAADMFCRWYGITEPGNFEGKSIPNLLGQHDIDAEPKQMSAIREELYTYRLSRTTLHKDDKVLTAWNGLMIAALAKAGSVLDEPRYLDSAARAYIVFFGGAKAPPYLKSFILRRGRPHVVARTHGPDKSKFTQNSPVQKLCTGLLL